MLNLIKWNTKPTRIYLGNIVTFLKKHSTVSNMGILGKIMPNPPDQMKKELMEGDCVFFIGSQFLNPPRHNHMEEIISCIKIDTAAAEYKKAHTWRGAGIGTYSQLRGMLKKLWSEKNYLDLQRLITEPRDINTLVTTLFDSYITTALESKVKNLQNITGTMSTQPEQTKNISQKDFVLYQLLGNIDKPGTMRISLDTYSHDDSVYAMRDEFKSSSYAAQFLKSRLEKKVLIFLGYDINDIYDSFFGQLINDMYFNSGKRLLTRDIYFVNKVGYDTYYGLWEDRDKTDLNIIPLSPSEFIDRIIR